MKKVDLYKYDTMSSYVYKKIGYDILDKCFSYFLIALSNKQTISLELF